MNDRMKQNLDRQLCDVAWTAADTHAVRLGMLEQPAPRRKMPAALVLALVAMLMVTAAVATTQSGLLGLIQRMQYPDLPNEAQSYIQTDGTTLETEDFLVTIPESYYDGRTIRMTVTVAPKEGRKLLYSNTVSTNSPWQRLIHMKGSDEDRSDTRTVQDLFDEFERVHSVHLNVVCDEITLVEGAVPFFYSREFAFDPETCTLTFFLQARLEENLPEREVGLKMTIYENVDGMLVHHQRLLHTILLKNTTTADMYECNEPSYFPEAGVRIDKLALEVRPQDIYYTIDYTILDWKGSYTQRGIPSLFLWFYKTLPPQEGPAKKLSSGLNTSNCYRRVKDTQYVVTGVLARSELHDTYYIGVRDEIQKIRLGVNTFHVHPVNAE